VDVYEVATIALALMIGQKRRRTMRETTTTAT